MRIAVIGAGVLGLATASALMRSGNHELRCYESSEVMGSRSKGDTRIFRVSHRDPRMIELAVQARSVWDEWSATAGINLVGYEGLLTNTSDRADRAATMQALKFPLNS